MPKSPNSKSMTELLRESLAEAPSMYAVAKATGVPKASLIRFLRGDQSIRLEAADKVAAHFGIECRLSRRQKGK